MKKTFYIILFALIASVANAQIPNSGFETWTDMGSYKNPSSWSTMNNTTALSGIFTATQASPGSPGSFYLKLTSKTVNSVVINGIAVSGVLDTLTMQPKSGFPFTQRPQSFTGKWQHMIYGSSQGSVAVALTRWNSILGKRDTVAAISQKLSGMAMSWANFSLDFNYLSVEYPDSCIIVLQASGASPAANDYLWVDNLAFSGTISGIPDNSKHEYTVSVFPNPATDELNIGVAEAVGKGSRLVISDMTGKVVFDRALNERLIKINTTNFASGMYVFKITNPFNVQIQEGKFNILH